MQKISRILIIQTAFLGDVVLATPLIEKLVLHYPSARIDFLLRKGNEGLLKGHPHLTEVFIWDKTKGKHKNLFHLIQRIRKEKYDLVVNAQRFFSSGLLAVLSGAKEVVGFDKNPLSFCYSKRLPHQLKGQHEIERNLSLIEHLTDSTLTRPKLYPSQKEFKEVSRLVPDNQSFITIAPTSVWFTKQLPAQKWIELLNGLSETLEVYLIGGPNDFLTCEGIRQITKHPKVYNLAGKINLLQSAALMTKAAMNYANDSAPIHIASAMNAPMCAVFCSTVPTFGFTPLSDQHFIVETQENLPCRPCGLHGKKACPEGHFNCAAIKPDQLLAIVNGVI